MKSIVLVHNISGFSYPPSYLNDRTNSTLIEDIRKGNLKLTQYENKNYGDYDHYSIVTIPDEATDYMVVNELQNEILIYVVDGKLHLKNSYEEVNNS